MPNYVRQINGTGEARITLLLHPHDTSLYLQSLLFHEIDLQFGIILREEREGVRRYFIRMA